MHESKDTGGSELSRRTFLERLFTATIVSAVTPSIIFGKAIPRVVAKADSFSGIYTVDVNDVPALQSVGGSVRLSINEISSNFRIIITRVSETHFEAVNARCPHEGNLVRARQDTNDYLECSAHYSRFQFDGTFIDGPADGKHLTRYSTTFDGVSILEIEIDAISSIEETGDRSAYVALHSTGPLSGQVVFEYALGNPTQVMLTIWSLDGREVLRPLEAYREAGTYRLPCDLSSLPAGVYLYRLTTPAQVIGSGKLPIGR